MMSAKLIIVVFIVASIVPCHSQGQQLRRRQQQHLSEVQNAPAEYTQHQQRIRPVAPRERQLVEAEKSLQVQLDQVEISRRGYEERETVLADREVALDVRDADLDARSRDLDRKILQTDKRLKEREARLAKRESELATREQEILKMAEFREQEIERLSRERETNAAVREQALIARENKVASRERDLGIFNEDRQDASVAESTLTSGNRRQRLSVSNRARSGTTNARRIAPQQSQRVRSHQKEQTEVSDNPIEVTSQRTRRLRQRQ